ncbi:ArnT family glycosyltransferase [Desulfosarcina ovata]|uniref:Phospholipid carrier-dependent glycosyltransferase n=1 Tax=Desulfosarcina ovata subsp. ovata TaxID=2752305 RepID=A0A5K8AGD7_9BACT|nr:glycosyltransferase family 39 protein [Desulfosarcina ovata]BBO91707.1 phospholipid carrier-dependent glycosyltransferase [Desulfosarcina ovata subsp. ovata]
MIRKNGRTTIKWLWVLLIVLGALRLMFLGAYPLADTTEARYGNIARLMVETGDWITPQYSLGVPFWGKPPLSTWLAAGAMKLFGINEFSARVPSFAMSLAVMVLVWRLAVRQRSRDHAMAAVLVLATAPLFFVSSGAVMTDPALLAGTTLCMVAFWQALIRSGRAGRLWGYAFFVGLAIGLLAKGPVAVVLTLFPIGIWVLLQRCWREVWERLPWLGGAFLTICLSAPWYYLAEQKTPGFLNYFIIGEHWNRFTIPGWKGDLYGHAHLRPKGTIWLYGLACTLPWSPIFLVGVLKKETRMRMLRQPAGGDGWRLYLVLWAAAPLVFFTLASNILWTYVLPGLPALALLTAELILSGSRFPENPLKGFLVLRRGALVMLLLFSIGLVGIVMGYGPSANSQSAIVAAYRNMSGNGNGPLVYLFKRPYSADFYSRGKARFAGNLNEAAEIEENQERVYFAVRSKDLKRLPESFPGKDSIVFQTDRYCLLFKDNASLHLQIGEGPITGLRERI